MENNDFVSIWLAENGNPAIEELTKLNVEVAIKATEVLANKDLSANDLACALDINPDEIVRWLLGRHTFSVKVIEEISSTISTKL